MSPLTDYDRGRISRIDETRAQALAAADNVDRGKTDIIRKLLEAPPRPLDVRSLPGNWRCRSLQIGGSLFSVSVNSYFSCRIRAAGGRLTLEKLTGSIRRSGPLVAIDNQRLLYYGPYFAQGDKQKPYGLGSPYDEVGIVWRISPTRLRLELPEPYASAEALHEVIDLVK
jgi:hypothetical protein